MSATLSFGSGNQGQSKATEEMWRNTYGTRKVCPSQRANSWFQGAKCDKGPRRNEGLDKHHCLKRHLQTLSQATYPCAFAYSYARIRRLVRLGGGFYCGSVADESAIGFRSPDQSRRTALPIVAIFGNGASWRLCAGYLRVCRVP